MMKDYELKEFNWFDEALLIPKHKVDKLVEDVKKGLAPTPEKNIKAFLDTIAYAEGTLLFGNEDGYNVIVGGSLFHDYSDHPRVLVNIPNHGIKSSAAGRYQVLQRYWDHYKKPLKLTDFSPSSQDAYAVNMFVETKALSYIEEGDFDEAARRVSSRWASFPDAGYGQPEKKLEDLRHYYQLAGGYIND